MVCYLGTTPVLTVARRSFKRSGPRQRVVDYRHLVGSLIVDQEATGFPALGIPRRAVPELGLSPHLGEARSAPRFTQGLPGICRAAASRRHAGLRGGARPLSPSRPRCRRHTRSPNSPPPPGPP